MTEVLTASETWPMKDWSHFKMNQGFHIAEASNITSRLFFKEFISSKVSNYLNKVTQSILSLTFKESIVVFPF